MKFARRSVTDWCVYGRWYRFETGRVMVPVEKLRNPFAGIRNWKLVIGKFSITWYG